ncbi:hypothetical protein G8759_21185 [Spirosoma aureum]|uniref:Peptidase M1 membrane alanine aminopeptidase domain-containing protein n=1 Tax=Spirosoma aureum TaxID=2692134 RepID=A0A6G9ARI9_9BACT|nr:M1 family aminopeptidase [Spirosoma aureum]QIP14954.1 hypothetical protein G8759_21185 [Spirosoma aureum]
MVNVLLPFEIRYHLRQISFRAAAILFFGLGILAIQGSYGGEEVHKNSPYAITVIVGLLSLCSIFASTIFCANVVLRDTTYKMDAIVFTTAVGRLPYFGVRFFGLFMAVFLLLCLSLLGIAAGSLLLDDGQTGPFRFAYFWQPLLVFGLPNILFSSSLIFCTAMLSQNVRAIYVAGVLLYILYWTASILGNSPLLATSSLKLTEPDPLPFLLDPFGLAALFGEARLWSDWQRNNQLFPLQNVFLLNRLLWTVFAGLLLTVSYRYFSFRLHLPAQTRQKTRQESVNPVRYSPHRVHPQGYTYGWKTFKSQLKLEIISLVKHIPFMVMLLLWIFLFAIELKDTLFSGSYGIRSYPSTGVIIDELRAMRLAMLLIIFYAAELLGRERAASMQELIYSTPVFTSSLWGAKCVTLGVLVAILVSANIGIGIVVQLSNGYFTVELPTYLTLYYYSGLPLFLFAILAIFIQTIIPNKYLGMLLSMLVAFCIVFSRRLGIEHYLLRYATVPELTYSYLNGFGHYAKAFNGYMLYWGSFAVVLSLLTVGLWQNGQYSTGWQRVKSIGSQWGISSAYVGAAAVLLWLFTSSSIYYDTNVIGNYKSTAAKLDWQLRYEQQFKPFSRHPQPIIRAVKTDIALYPKAGKYTVKGSYRLKNESAEPITKIWVGIDPEVTASRLSIPGAKETRNTEFNQHWFLLNKPLGPGSEITLQFSMEVIRSGFVPFNSEHAVVENGTYIELEKYVPFLGYNSRFETDDARARKKSGLPTQSIPGPADNRYHLIDLETTVSTEPDQYVVTVGDLQKSWIADQRRYFHYKTTVPINFMFALSSARYTIKKEIYKGIELSICYQDGQIFNIASMMQAMKDALHYCKSNFSHYPLKHFTLAEIPQYKGAATAYPGLIFSAERINFLSDFRDTDKINYGYAIVAHEVSHQWWANKLAPVNGPGDGLLTESLAKYTEAMVVEKTFGKMLLRNYLQADNRLYFSMRNTDGKELPLDQATDQPFVYYQKGGLVLYAIKETLGEEKFNRALQRLIEKHAYPGTKATPDDLIHELKQDATASQARRIDDWLRKVIVYSLKVTVVSCESLVNGQFRLTLRVNMDKTEQGSNKSLLPDDEIDVALFDRKPADWDQQLKPVYLQKHQFSKAETLLTITVTKKPQSVAIDPYGYLLDENQSDNTQEIRFGK